MNTAATCLGLFVPRDGVAPLGGLLDVDFAILTTRCDASHWTIGVSLAMVMNCDDVKKNY